jgi:hypothetical protein
MTRTTWVFFALFVQAAHAEPWLCTLADGRKEWSYEAESAASRACVDHPLSRGYVRKAPPRNADGYAEPADFPRVDAKTQKKRDVARRDILERELQEERKALADAARKLGQIKQGPVAAGAPAIVREYEERIRTHKANIANLEKELAKAG